MARGTHTERMHPLTIISAVHATRRAVRGSGPDGEPTDAAAPASPRRFSMRPRQAPRPAPQSGSDQCNIVAAPRNPARA
jgi:hypothetical protein